MTVHPQAVELFQRAAAKIPAYREFLKSKGFDPKTVTSPESFAAVPTTNKKQYLTQFPLDQLVWPEDLVGTMVFCATSGSTGEPYYFPRNDELSRQYAHVLKGFLDNSSYGTGSTLVLVGFGMGVWIGGVITLRAFEIAGEKASTPLSILPTGYNKAEIFKALRKLSPQFSQTIIVGYPPFVKELVDEAPGEGIDLASLHIRFLFAAEAFTETFRNYLCEKAGIKDPLRDTLNIYGTADIGAMAAETPLSILARRLVLEDPLLIQDLFKQIEKTPTLAQYNPEHINFENVDGEVVLTGDSALPLIRYAVGDSGGVVSYDELKSLLQKYGMDLEEEIKKAGIADTVNRQHPFVFVYERTDLSVTLHGINIYPEFVKEGLLDPVMTQSFTERFTMATKNDIHHNQFLQVNIEMQKGIEPDETLQERALKHIRKSLLRKSSEFAEISKSRNSEKLIQVVLWPNGHPRYFSPGTKQKWVEKA